MPNSVNPITDAEQPYQCAGTSAWRISIALFVITFLAFLSVLWCGSIKFDDAAYTQNPLVLRGLSLHNIAAILQDRVLELWHPLSLLSFALDYSLFGLNPTLSHLENLLIHCLSVALLFTLLRNVTASTWRSALATLLFAVHPLRVESVAWIAERKDLLSVLFLFLALLAYVRYCRTARWLAYLLAIVCQILSLLAKPTFVTLPILLLLLDYWPLRRFSNPGRGGAAQARLLISEKLPFLAISIAIGLFALYGPAITHEPAKSYLAQHAFSLRLTNSFISCVRYLFMLVWFADLNIFYPMPSGWPLWQVIASGTLLLAISLTVLALAKRLPFLAFGWCWYLIALFPTLGIVTQICEYAIADRYAYIPTLGIIIALVWLLPERLMQAPSTRRAFLSACAATILLLGAFTWRQCTYWRDTLSTFGHAVQVYPDNAIARLNYSSALLAAGRPADAADNCARVLQLRPEFVGAWFNLGLAYAQLQQPDRAITAFERGLDMLPTDATANLEYAKILSSVKRSDDAIAVYRRWLQTHPADARFLLALGAEYEKTGRDDQALASYQQAAAAAPTSPSAPTAHLKMAALLIRLNRYEEAIAHCDSAAQTNPSLVEAHYDKAVALLKLGRVNEALDALTKALEIDPANPQVRQLINSIISK